MPYRGGALHNVFSRCFLRKTTTKGKGTHHTLLPFNMNSQHFGKWTQPLGRSNLWQLGNIFDGVTEVLYDGPTGVLSLFYHSSLFPVLYSNSCLSRFFTKKAFLNRQIRVGDCLYLWQRLKCHNITSFSIRIWYWLTVWLVFHHCKVCPFFSLNIVLLEDIESTCVTQSQIFDKIHKTVSEPLFWQVSVRDCFDVGTA